MSDSESLAQNNSEPSSSEPEKDLNHGSDSTETELQSKPLVADLADLTQLAAKSHDENSFSVEALRAELGTTSVMLPVGMMVGYGSDVPSYKVVNPLEVSITSIVMLESGQMHVKCSADLGPSIGRNEMNGSNYISFYL